MSMFAILETPLQDLRYTLRTIRQKPAFAITAIAMLAVGIGANTAMFTIVRAVLLKPLEYRDPDQLVHMTLENPRNVPITRGIPFTMPRVEQTRAAVRSFSSVGSYLRVPEAITLSGSGEPESVQGARVSANFLEVLGAKAPMLGRSFLPDEDAPGSPSVALLSADLWRRRFDASPNVVGQKITLDTRSYTVVGVMPDGFAFPFAGLDLWVSKPIEQFLLPSRFWQHVTTQVVFARLNPGVSLDQARAEMAVVNQQYIKAAPERADAQPDTVVRIDMLQDRIVSNVRPMLWILLGAVSVVLIVACANLASLLMARASSRSREFAVRAALGASRLRLAAQMLTESCFLSVVGGGLGVLLAYWILRTIPAVTPLPLPRAEEIKMDAAVLGFTSMLCLVTGILFGLIPAAQGSRVNLAGFLREAGAAAGRGSSRLRSFFGVTPRAVLVVTQVALSIVLLVGAALLLQSFQKLRMVDPGFDPKNLLTAKLSLPPARYDTPEKRARFFNDLEPRLASIPGVQNAGIARSIPTTQWFWTNVAVEGQPELESREQPRAQFQSVTPGYFEAMKIPLRRGRLFTARDNAPGAPPAYIVNETFARQFWPNYPEGLNPVGQHMGDGANKIIAAEIVGIVGDIREGGIVRRPTPEFYISGGFHAPQIAYLVVRTSIDPTQMVNAIRAEVRAIDPDQPLADIRMMSDILDKSMGHRRLSMMLLTTFAAFALALALIGLYGSLAYSVAQRTQELGIRRALGAETGNLLRLILSEAASLTGLGVILGCAAALGLTRVMKSLLFGIQATDAQTFIAVALLFIVTATAASLIPAWRATRVDPMIVLRAA